MQDLGKQTWLKLACNYKIHQLKPSFIKAVKEGNNNTQIFVSQM